MIGFAPIRKIAALECLDIAKSGGFEIIRYPLGLIAGDDLNPRILSRLVQHQVSSTLVHRKQAITTQDDLIASLQGRGGSRPEMIPKCGPDLM